MDYVKDLLLSKNNRSAEFINPTFVKQKLEEHVSGKAYHRLLIWSLMNFEIWTKQFLD